MGDSYGASEAKRTWRRNLLVRSQEFDSASWVVAGSLTKTANTTTAPDGTNTADTLSGTGFVYQTITSGVSTNSVATASVYVKAPPSNVGQTRIRIMDSAIAANIASSSLTWTNGVPAITVTIGTGSISSVGDGWYRFVIHGTLTNNSASMLIYPDQNGNDRDIYVWGAQLELGSTPTEYQPITDFSTEFKQAYPTHSLYQDANGVTPAVYPNDPVALVIDSGRGGLANLGPELLENGTPLLLGTATAATFDTSTGAGSVTRVDSLNQSHVAFPTQADKWYRVTISNSGSVSLWLRDGGPGGIVLYAVTAGSTVTVIVKPSYANLTVASSTTATITFTLTSVREIPGVHAYQTSSGSRPLLCRTPFGGRRNVLTYTEDISNAYWVKTTGGTGTAPVVTANQAANPLNGLVDADQVVFALNGGTTFTDISQLATGQTTPPSAEYTFSFYAKTTDGTTKAFSMVSAAGTLVTISITGTWQRFTQTGTGNGFGRLRLRGGESTADSASIYFWGAQFETGSTATAYQKVTTTTDVTEAGKADCWGLLADGVDDFLQTPSIGFNTWTQETRRNLLVDTESLGASSWGQGSSTNGTAVAGVLTVTDVEGFTYFVQAGTFDTAADHAVTFDVTCNQTVANVPLRLGGTVSVSQLVNLTSGETTRITFTGYRPFTGTGAIQIGLDLRNAVVPGGSNETGYTVTLNRVQMELGSTPTDYQRVGTDEMTVMAGVRKLSDAADGNLVELTTNWNTSPTNNGGFYLWVPEVSATPDLAVASGARGTQTVNTNQRTSALLTSYPLQQTLVISSSHDISGDLTTLRVNATAESNATGEKGGGNFANAAIYLMRRGGTTNPLSGILYSLIVRGTQTPTGTVRDFEKLLAKRAGVTF